MNQEKMIYLVSSGSYSDYKVDYVCLDKALAEKIVEINNQGYEHGETSLEEFPITESIKTIPYRKIRVVITSEGIEENFEDSTTIRLEDDAHYICEWTWHKAYLYQPGFLTVEGSDIERVGKVFSEKKALYLANPQMRIHPAYRGK